MAMAHHVIVDCMTNKETFVEPTAEDEADLVLRQQEAALREAKEAQQEADKQLAISEMSKTPEGQQILKAMGVEPVAIGS